MSGAPRVGGEAAEERSGGQSVGGVGQSAARGAGELRVGEAGEQSMGEAGEQPARRVGEQAAGGAGEQPTGGAGEQPAGGPGEQTAPARRWPGAVVLWMFVVIALGLIGGGGFVAALGLAEAVESVLLAAVTATTLGVAVAVVVVGDRARMRAAGLRAAPRRAVMMGAVLAMPLLPLCGGIATLVRMALGQPVENPQVGVLFPESMTAGQAAVMALLVAGAVPFVEELVFRGVLFDALRERAGPRVALVGSSLLFGLMHVEPSIVVATALLGGALGALRLRSGSIWPSVALHAANNGLAMVAILLTEV